MDIPWDVIGSALGGGGIVHLFRWWNEKSKTRAYTMGAVDHAVQTALQSTTNEIERLNGEVAELRVAHRNCEKELQQSRQDRAELTRKIDELMAGRPATY